jgi:hypothetical protein
MDYMGRNGSPAAGFLVFRAQIATAVSTFEISSAVFF